jgi:3-hydroxyisobutyrate dehydrogenase-like beta-hydroxyacid dehydrogenase
VYNRTAERADELVAAGAKRAGSPAEAAAVAEMVITCVLDDAALEAVVFGEEGLLQNLGEGDVHVSTTTVSPGLTTRLAEAHASHGQRFVAAPVLGRPEAAAAGQLLTLAAGEGETIRDVTGVLSAYSREVVDVGRVPSQASAMKLTMNLYAVSMIEVFGEVLAFAEAAGLDRATAAARVKDVHAAPGIVAYLERIAATSFDDAGFELTTGLKDVSLMLDAATSARVPLPVASVARDHLLAAIAEGHGQRDWSALTEFARRADLQPRRSRT